MIFSWKMIFFFKNDFIRLKHILIKNSKFKVSPLDFKLIHVKTTLKLIYRNSIDKICFYRLYCQQTIKIENFIRIWVFHISNKKPFSLKFFFTFFLLFILLIFTELLKKEKNVNILIPHDHLKPNGKNGFKLNLNF